MANPKHLEVVRSGAATIETFRAANPECVFNLRGADLQGADLFRADLQGAKLRNAKLRNADLIHANLRNTDLRGADLQGAKLRGADLFDADLRNANLTHANLTHANLKTADLSNSNLTRAYLTFAYLNLTNLNNANLTGADLVATTLGSNNLSGANVSNVLVGHSVFSNLDLSEVRGLTEAIHSNPSTLGIDTLLRSQGTIPDVFLRGCGLPDDFIAFVPSFVGKPFDFYSCFISYSHKDKQFARQLHDRLQGEGIRCWLDEKELNPGDDLYHGIDRGIRAWDKVLLCSSRHSLSSWWCDNEIKIALDKERELQKTTGKKLLKIIPLNLDGFLFSDKWESGYRQQIRDRVAADFIKWKKDADEFDLQFEGVLKALRTDGGKLPEPKSKLT